jgi:hypothetical protein
VGGSVPCLVTVRRTVAKTTQGADGCRVLADFPASGGG